MNVHKKLIERVTITGLVEDRELAFAYCDRQGLRVRESGPRLKAGEFRVDASRFRIVAEREKR